MSRKTTNWLQIKVFSGLAILVLGAAAIIAYLDILTRENYANQELLSYVRQLDIQGKAIKRRGTTYAQNAPRDYAPYDRDVIIFYPDFMKDLQEFDKQIILIQDIANHLPAGILYSSDLDITDSINILESKWNNFLKGFQEKLGNNPKEPRLEWGADYVLENQDLINTITGMLINTTEEAIQNKLEANKKLSLVAISGAGILLILGIIWFYLSIVRRITLTIKGCQRVAQGDFGYQLPSQSNDELGALASAFNTLSARTRFVLTMLSKMHQHGSAENKIDSLLKEARGYLPIQWLGLWKVNKQDNSLTMMSIRSDNPMRSNTQQALISSAINDPHLLQISLEGKPVKYDNLFENISEIPKAKLLREILKIGLLKSALLVPLKSDSNWEGLLIFIASDTDAYSSEQLELMENLSPFMANGFSQT